MDYLILDLKDISNSDVHYKINKFPDGQKSITLLESNNFYKKVHVIISSSICNFADWELVLSAISALRNHTRDYSFYTPYVIGARSDRKFEAGGDFYFTDISEKLLSDMKCPIYIHDLHCKSSFNILHPFLYSKFELDLDLNLSDYTFIFPDESAYMRHQERTFSPLFEKCIFKKKRINEKVIQQPKNISDENTLKGNDDFIIFDDLFDGGASFVNLCKDLRNKYNKNSEIIIFVTHFIGSNIDNLNKLRDLDVEIITTNSYNCSNEAKHYVTQLNVFNKEYILEMCIK